MSDQQISQDLESAHHKIGAVRLRMNIQKVIVPNWEEFEEQLNGAVAALVRAQEQLRRLKRSKARRL